MFFDDVKLALRISSDAVDQEIQGLVDDCLGELTMLGIYDAETMTNDPQIRTAVICYAKSHYGSGIESDKWANMYQSKVEKLQVAADYGGRAIP